MKKKQSLYSRCESWYHQKWFRIVLVFIAIDMFILGFSFAIGVNVLVFFAGIVGTITRAIIGILYVMVAGYILNHTLHYKRHIKEHHLVCDCYTKES